MGSHRRPPIVLLAAFVVAAAVLGFGGAGAGAPAQAGPGSGLPSLAGSDWGPGQAVLGARSETESLGSGTVTTGERTVAGTGGAGSVSAGGGRCRVRRDRGTPSGPPASCQGAHLRSPPG